MLLVQNRYLPKEIMNSMNIPFSKASFSPIIFFLISKSSSFFFFAVKPFEHSPFEADTFDESYSFEDAESLL